MAQYAHPEMLVDTAWVSEHGRDAGFGGQCQFSVVADPSWASSPGFEPTLSPAVSLLERFCSLFTRTLPTTSAMQLT